MERRHFAKGESVNHNLADLQKEIATLKRKLAEKDAELSMTRLALSRELNKTQSVRLKVEGIAT